jgi:hypothetical protein
MRRICTFVPAVAFTGTLAFASTGAADAPSQAYRPSARPAGTATSPNQVIVWNRILLGILGTPGAQPATIHPTRSLAMVHVAIADAVGAISRRFTPYRFELTTSRYASQAAATASAAHEVLVALYPAMKSTLDADLASSLMTVRNGSGKTAGMAIGVRAGQSILQLRQDDGSGWPTVTPFVLQRADQFRPGPPPAITSDQYANALAEVKSLGQENSMTRTPDQTQIAQFWSAPIQNYWNEIAQTASLAHHDSVGEDARLFALLNTSFADDVIAFYDAKYAYRFWRPVTAVNNDGIPADAAWAPLVKTPADPSYPGAHSVISFDAATILSQAFGERFDFAVSSAILPGVLRHFSSFSAAALEAGLSRIYAGEHFRFDHEAGKRLGLSVADYVAEHQLALQPAWKTRW